MRDQINAFLSNDSSFGRLMTRLGVMIGANLMFVLFSFPLVTLGAAWAALDFVMLKTLRGDGEVNPFVQFWIGFRDNFRQATLVWLAALLIAALAVVDVRFLLHMGGGMVNFRYAIYAVLLLLLIELIYLFPLMAAFSNKLSVLLRGAFAFAFRKPLKTLVLLFFHVFPFVLTYSDAQLLPLYAFLWALIGFGALAMLTARLLLPEIRPLLPLVDEYGCFILDEDGKKRMPGMGTDAAKGAAHEKSEAEILEEMEKLGM